MKLFHQILQFFKLLIPLCLVVFYSSCGKDDTTFLSKTGNTETFISLSTSDTILYAVVDNAKVPVYLSIPKECGNKDYPAVVVLHGSDGMWKNNNPEGGVMSGQNTEWRKLFDDNCIIGAYVDSYSPRGTKERTGKWTTAPDNFKISSQFVRPRDANAALSLLRNLKFNDGSKVVRSKDVGLLGFSDGASAVAATLYNSKSTPPDWEWTQKFNEKEYDTSSGVRNPADIPVDGGFAGGVFYYGGSGGYDYWGSNPCSENALNNNVYNIYAPMLYQIPADGYLTENTICSFNLLKSRGTQVEMNIYEGVGHGFDFDHLEQSYIARNSTINWFKSILNINSL